MQIWVFFFAKKSQIPTFLFSIIEDDTRYPKNTVVFFGNTKIISSILEVMSSQILFSRIKFHKYM